MSAATASDIAVSIITALSVLGGAAMGLVGVMYTVRKQKRPRIVDMDHDELRKQLVTEVQARIAAEVERDVWKQIALDARRALPE